MGPFGYLFIKSEGKEEGGLNESKKKYADTLTNLVRAMMEDDHAEVYAALAKTMQCWKCGHEFSTSKFLKPMPDKNRWYEVKCPNPKCDAPPAHFGPKS